MNEYKVFVNPQKQYEAVKQGWSWPGFCFGVFWAFFKRMWKIGGGIILAVFIIAFIMGMIGMAESESAIVTRFLGIIVGVGLGVKGNELRETNLESRGYDEMETVQASNPEGAIALTIKNSKK